MNAQSWARLKVLLADVLAVESEQREVWINDHLGDDADLESELRSLLAAHDEAEPLFESVLEEQRRLELAPGSRLGAYRVESELGRGGMGVVYLGARDDDSFELQAAVKLLDADAMSRGAERRFMAERQILARLDHPGIARMLDGGTTDDGTPFLVMEYVPGEPIDAYCRRRHLDLDERLELFGEICAAVDYAHRNLVVHRDLKPSNIIVNAQGRPKLLDFGIAKLVGEGLPGTPVTATQTGLLAFTPAYASPEQLRGDAIATTSDVYSLGVVLYELLTAQRPYELRDQSLSEVVRIVCEVDPPPASAAVTQHAAPSGSHPRGTAPAQPHQLRGDLDAIVSKALRKEPASRYQSVADLAADLLRYREGLPVKARRGTTAYRAAKFMRRHRLGVATVSFVVLLLAAFASVMTVQVARTRRALARAEEEAAKALAVQDFLEETLGAADPQTDAGRRLTVQEALDRARQGLATSFADQPEIGAAVRQLLGSLYSRMGRYEDAETLLNQALASRRVLPSTAEADLAESLESLATLYGRSGRAADAVPLLEQALAIRRRASGPWHESVASDLDLLAHSAAGQGEFDRAVALATESLEVYRRALGTSSPSVVHALSSLAGFNRAADHLDQAELALEEAAAILDSSPDTPLVTRAELSMDRGELYESQGRYRDAEVQYRNALDLHRQLYGSQHHWVAQSLVRLGTVLTRQHRFTDAEPPLREGVALLEQLLDSHHPDIATAHNNLAFLLAERGDLSEAVTELEKVLQLQRQSIPGHPFMAVTLRSLGQLQLRLGRPEQARAALEEALDIETKRRGLEHPNTARSQILLGWALGELGDWRRAAAMQEEALTRLDKSLAVDDPRLLEATSLYASSLARCGQQEEAIQLVRPLLPKLEAVYGSDDYRTRRARAILDGAGDTHARG